MAKSKGIDDDLNTPIKPEIKLRTNHLLLISIDNYSDKIGKLDNAVSDAEKFRDVLFKKFNFSADNYYELFNQNATHEAILKMFDRLTKSLKETDNLIMYFSGHGILHPENNRGYWIPVDARPNYRSDYVNNSEVTDFLDNVKAHHVFSIIDSCFSEALFRKRNINSGYKKVEKFPSRWALSAGRLEPVSDGFPGGASPFAHSLITFLENETKEAIWVNQICQHVMENVSFSSTQTPRGEPLPSYKHQGGQFIFRKKGFTENVDEKTEQKDSNPNRGTGTVAPSEIKTKPQNNIEFQLEETPSQPQSFADWGDQMKELIALDMSQAMVSLNGGFNRSSSKYNDLVLLRARLNSAKMDAKRGVVTSSQTNMIHNQIRYALIELIDDLKETDMKRLWIQRD